MPYSIINSLFGSTLTEGYSWDNLYGIPSQSYYIGLYELSEESQKKGLYPSLMSRIKLIESRHLLKKEDSLAPIPEEENEEEPGEDWFDEGGDDELWGEDDGY